MKDTEEFAERYKNIVIFESDRKYVKYLNRFQQVLDGYKKYGNVDVFLDGIRNSDGKINLQKAIEKCEEWPRFGRFCAFLFLETFVGLCQFDIENTTIDWKHGATATSGILNVFGADSAADKFDKTGKLPEGMTKEILDKMLFTLIGKIEKAGGSTNVTEIETSLCAYRKFYKGTRYNGYYLDRMLENIIEIGGRYPEIERELLQIRAKKFKEKSLGEFSGWQGIRKEKKKEYINTGKIDVEYL